MTPVLDYSAIKAFVKGSDPPVKDSGEDLDAFQERTILWLKSELKTVRLLVWGLILFHALMYGDMKGLV